ncbi:DUF4123 domain-containing protein [Pseudomonas chengduensis]|uniref:DUF4123 domain-containing protein n=2 Tax=Pseudomonadaceae TaxID=135621 RepID=A0A1H2N8D9_9PSED|nr:MULTISPECIES: DUF4123 domain-containing protein [Pseudomonas]KQO44074.1 hypothetical protein ASF15_02140 [Pseudomonas sp. Leaf83]MBP3064306.1 DUF4123 domain-containing protein [Pseudomonas chengduensis]MDH0957957.1 DUF4123 domain-containing protein [Pseudomonas chengduensis]MDH1535955.1 DUF4123 domain-containing protein [Pseudomonas chengduensis]MDH1557427.1 DUF4123 domain-containing protein [Pseudomonas chengduensis]
MKRHDDLQLDASSNQAREWITGQFSLQRDLLIVLDPLAEPDPVVALFGAGLAQDHLNLYLGTEFADLAPVAPWLARLPDGESDFIDDLLANPQRNWGWLASVERFDRELLTQHWRERMLIENDGQRALYRLQDNRVIAHHLAHLPPEDISLLLGPLTSALCWDGAAWSSFDNPAPGPCLRPFPTPWQEIAERQPVAERIVRHNLLQWLWQRHATDTARLADSEPLDDWLDGQLAKAKNWQWQSPEQVRFLIRHQLTPELASHPAWPAREGETPEQHFIRCQSLIDSAEA